MLNRPYKFFFHYNKPASRAKGEPVFTVHYKGACHPVSKVVAMVPVETETRKRQPHAVVTGRANSLALVTQTDGKIRAELRVVDSLGDWKFNPTGYPVFTKENATEQDPFGKDAMSARDFQKNWL